MRDRTHIRSRRNVDPETSAITFKTSDLEILNLNFNGLEFHLFVLARQLVRWNAANLLGRIRWGHLLNHADKRTRRFPHLFKCYLNIASVADLFAVRVVSVGREAESYFAFVALIGRGIELREPRHASSNQRKNAGCHWIQRAQVSNRLLAQYAPHTIHDVMRRHSRRLIDYDYSIHLLLSCTLTQHWST